ncbi:MAG: DNA-3-methyladenine glycosylase [Chloroflexota bacterium]|nr:DNA-3-methyladenine glycosylase [Chloroflexota bacterium]
MAERDRGWFDRPALAVARELIGARLVHETRDGVVAGVIVETEAYAGPEDLAAHSARGRTPRNAVMFGPPGHAYVYLVYGIHHCVNVVCGPGEKPEAVLLRAATIDVGLEVARRRRGSGVADHRLAAGPGNLTVAFAIDRASNGGDLIHGPLRVEPGAAPRTIATSVRIGVAYSGAWAELPWRFMAAGDPHVSRPARGGAQA